jgi:hypothetical protein
MWESSENTLRIPNMNFHFQCWDSSTVFKVMLEKSNLVRMNDLENFAKMS